MFKKMAVGLVTTLIAGMALGYFFLPILFPLQAESSRTTQFSVQNTDTFSQTGSWQTIPNLNITFSTTAGDTVTITFTCQLYMDPSSTPTNLLSTFCFAIDGSRLSSDYYCNIAQNFQVDYTFALTVAYQYVLETPSAETHNVSVQAYCGGSYQYIQSEINTLTVEIF